MSDRLPILARSEYGSTQAQFSASSRSLPQSVEEFAEQYEHDQFHIGTRSRNPSPPTSSDKRKGKEPLPQPPEQISIGGFEEFVANGKRMHQWMAEEDVDRLTEMMRKSKSANIQVGEKSQSRFTSYLDIFDNGWSKNPAEDQLWVDEITITGKDAVAPVDQILKDFDISSRVPTATDRDAPNVPVIFKQDHKVYNAKRHEMHSDAFLVGTFNPTDGVIVIAKSMAHVTGLKIKMKESNPNWTEMEQWLKIMDNLPELDRMSDLVFLEWYEQCLRNEVNPRDLRLGILYTIGTFETLEVVDQILRSRKFPRARIPDRGTHEAPPWKYRLTLRPDSNDFHALLATPDAAIMTFLLLQHKAQLGLKRVKAIHISLDQKSKPLDMSPFRGHTLTFEFEDVPPSDVNNLTSLGSGENAWMRKLPTRGESQSEATSSRQPQQGWREAGHASFPRMPPRTESEPEETTTSESSWTGTEPSLNEQLRRRDEAKGLVAPAASSKKPQQAEPPVVSAGGSNKPQQARTPVVPAGGSNNPQQVKTPAVPAGGSNKPQQVKTPVVPAESSKKPQQVEPPAAQPKSPKKKSPGKKPFGFLRKGGT